jgi:hypothetical protein
MSPNASHTGGPSGTLMLIKPKDATRDPDGMRAAWTVASVVAQAA